ncbi:MAG TPA: CBS domain-containing protein [Candidatus Polarisedimenticolia bacterium]|nr:CBS domain-containing protein [Candidatus Polarisedimenticolia bacterium]
MRIEKVMHRPVVTVKSDDHLGNAARLMWEEDCGVLPVVDAEDRVIAMITDRDVCMAAYTQGRPLESIPVSSAMSSQLFAVRATDAVEVAEREMGEKQVRRLPVLDTDGRVLGILSVNDLAREATRFSGGRVLDANTALVRTLKEVGTPHHGRRRTA